MNSVRKHASRKAIYLLALGLSLIPASAAAQSKPSKLAGKFSLTSETYCANTVLAPGSYSFTLSSSGPFAVIRISKDQRLVAAFISQSQVRSITPSQDVLTLVKKGGGPYVQSLDLPELGVEFKFPVPKPMAMPTEAPVAP